MTNILTNINGLLVGNSSYSLRDLSVSQRSYQLPSLSLILPYLLLTVTQPDRSGSNREACSVKWLSCKYRLSQSKTLIICKLIQHSPSSPLTSGRVWIIFITERGGAISDQETERGKRVSHTAHSINIYVCVCFCVCTNVHVRGCWSIKLHPRDDLSITPQRTEIVPGKIYENGHKR